MLKDILITLGLLASPEEIRVQDQFEKDVRYSLILAHEGFKFLSHVTGMQPDMNRVNEAKEDFRDEPSCLTLAPLFNALTRQLDLFENHIDLQGISHDSIASSEITVGDAFGIIKYDFYNAVQGISLCKLEGLTQVQRPETPKDEIFMYAPSRAEVEYVRPDREDVPMMIGAGPG